MHIILLYRLIYCIYIYNNNNRDTYFLYILLIYTSLINKTQI